MGDPLTKVLTKVGVMEVRKEPFRVVAFIRTFKHPDTKTSITLAPQPNFAAASYYTKTNYDNYKNYGYVIYEDGYDPVTEGSTGAWRGTISRKFWPFVRRRPILPEGVEGVKYIGTPVRDVEESRIAYNSTIKMLDPSVDPRARKGLDKLEEIPAGSRISIPWHSMHVPYIQKKLVTLGYEVVQTQEMAILAVSDIKKMMLHFFAFAVPISAFFTYKIVKWLWFPKDQGSIGGEPGDVPQFGGNMGPRVLGENYEVAGGAGVAPAAMPTQQQQFQQFQPQPAGQVMMMYQPQPGGGSVPVPMLMPQQQPGQGPVYPMTPVTMGGGVAPVMPGGPATTAVPIQSLPTAAATPGPVATPAPVAESPSEDAPKVASG